MAHEVSRLLGSIQNTPLLTTQDNLQQIQEYLSSRNAREDFAIASQSQAQAESNDYPPTVENGVGLLPIEGSLTYKHAWLNSLCGIVSYQKLLSDFQSLVEQGAHTIALDIDSPGGMAHGSMETAQEMRKLADENNVRIVTYVDGMAASAGFVFASISDEIIMNPMSKVGSIGVVISILNELPKKIEEGAEVIFVYSGESKVPYDASGKMRKEFIDELQSDTDALYSKFIEHVAQYRPMTSEQIRGTQAKMFRADQAISLGLADKEMTASEFIDYLAQLAEQRGDNSMPVFGFKKKKPEASFEDAAPSSELLEGNNQEGVQDNPESPSMQSKEETNEEVNMTLEELLASNPEAKEQFDALTSAKAEELSGELKKQLEKLESERVEAAKAEYKELVAGYSFVGADAQEKVATFLYNANAEKMEGVEEVMEALESARNAVEAVVDEEIGDSGEQLEVDEQARDQSLVREQIKKRYAK